MCQTCSINLPILKCGSCAQVEYCSEICAKLHWDAIHQYKCIGTKKRDRSDDDTWEEGDDDIFVLITDTNDRVEIERRTMRKSATLKHFSEDTDSRDLLVHGINTPTLRIIVSYLSTRKIPAFGADTESLFEFLNGLYYLDVTSFNFLEFLNRYNMFNLLMNLNEVPTLSLDIIKKYIIPTTKIELLERLQKKNFRLWELVAKPLLLYLVQRLFPRAAAGKKDERELIFAAYFYNKASNKMIKKMAAMEVYGLEQADLNGLEMKDDNTYKLNDVIDKALLKHGSIRNLEKKMQELNRRKEEAEEQEARISRIIAAQIEEARPILFEKYGHEFNYWLDVYKRNNRKPYNTVKELIDSIIRESLSKLTVYFKEKFKNTVQYNLVVALLTRNPRVFGLVTNPEPGSKDTAGKFIAQWINNQILYLKDLSDLATRQGVIVATADAFYSNLTAYYMDERNPLLFDSFRTMFLNKYDSLLNEALSKSNYPALKILLTDDKFKEVLLQVITNEHLYYFKDLKLEKK